MIRVYGWQWMTYTVTQMPKQRKGERFNPLKSIEEQPGFCYLQLFKKELRDKVDWPSFPTWMEVMNWEIELRDPMVTVGIKHQGNENIWHVSPRGHMCWTAIDKLMPRFGHHLVGADQPTYAAMAARNVTRRLTRQDTRIFFGGQSQGDWYNEMFRMMVEWMPSVHRKIDVWQQKVWNEQ